MFLCLSQARLGSCVEDCVRLLLTLSHTNTRQAGPLALVQRHRDTVLSLVEIMVLLRQLSYAIRTQFKASKAPY